MYDVKPVSCCQSAKSKKILLLKQQRVSRRWFVLRHVLSSVVQRAYKVYEGSQQNVQTSDCTLVIVV